MRSKVNIIKKFINSIYNLDEFPKYIKEGTGRAVLYALILSILTGVIGGIVTSINVNASIKEAVNRISDDKNKFSINNNELVVENSPIKIEDNGILLYADENLKIDDIDNLKSMTVNEDINFLILKDGIYIENNVRNIDGLINNNKLYYSDLNLNEEITNSDIVSTVDSVKGSIFGTIIIFYIIEKFLVYIVSAFFVAALAIIPSMLWGVKFKLSSLFSLVIYAYTLPNLLVLLLNIIFPGVIFDSAGMAGAIAYTYLAIRSIKRSLNEKVG